MINQYEELLEAAGNKLAIEWWTEMEAKLGKDYTKDIAKHFANGLISLASGELELEIDLNK